MRIMVNPPRSIGLVVLALALAAPSWAQAQPPSQTATQVYLEYRRAFDTADSIEDLFPFMAASVRTELEKMSATERAQIFGLVKVLGVVTNLKIVKESTTLQGVTLTVEGKDADGSNSVGTVTLVREDGALKMTSENWSPKTLK